MLFFKSATRRAIEFEKKGYDLYVRLAKEAQDKLTKALFKSLAIQEKEHIAYIQAFAKTHTFKKYKTNTVQSEIKKIWKVSKAAAIEVRKDQFKGYELAMSLEDKGYKMYAQAVSKAKDADEQKFYTFLRDMEQDHYASLANVYYYLTENDSWLEENESQTWNWMNM